MPDMQEMLAKRVVYTLPGMEQAQVQRDLTYKTVGDLALKLDVYQPSTVPAGTLRPAVVLIHGDADPAMLRDAKEWGQYVSYGQLLAVLGLVAVTFNHRSTVGLTQMADVAGDIDDLLTYVRGHAAEWQIDPDQLGLWVFSAGVPYGMRAAILDHQRSVRCCAAYYGPLDLRPLRAHVPAVVTEEALREFSPLYHLEQATEPLPPLLVVRCGGDRPWLNESIARFVAEALVRDVPLDFLNHPGAPHAFDVLDARPRSQAIIRHTLAFFQEHLASLPS
jgi:acetyl esterase/lipase